ncbi:cbb3-type cytochrome oxidase assembly protein CcoS [Noviherbaspirillum sp. Root189]|uniref:cbb3-type cytochrome oxidase assembly protein CcoS n=1 Tax=Noviherbaspirillum sp. Root189 TaxID=1736487 RepID=UPI00070EAA16|nr:cbb3-type cytochrome oxidase assembly protein CcoS [Noviherbaspirillum sp. Root189]KRB66332.1 cytochrome C oxidase Cbb3 [Noviherbaspirillum sp. Root189]
MEALYLLVPMSVLVVFFTIWLFFNASDGGQFDDLVGPAMRILQDDDSADAAEVMPVTEKEARHSS